jgi:C-terminal processing protease CtpA/Prc
MKKSLIFLLFVFNFYYLSGQALSKPDLNFGFEKQEDKSKLPDNWFRWGTADYIIKTDTIEHHSGKASLLLELDGAKTGNSFGCCAYKIPAALAGKQIELRAYMKLQNVANGPIGLLLRIDGQNGTLGFDNMQQRNIQGTSDWQMYSVEIPFPEDAETIYAGAILSGTGKLWVDDFQILIDGKDISEAKPRTKSSLKADSDVEFSNGSGVRAIVLTPSKIEDLFILGKIWGFLKYYHPAIAKGEYNWDNELFRILPELIKCTGEKERNELLTKWIQKLGKVETGSIYEPDDASVKLKPDLGWLSDDLKLGKDLTKQLQVIRDAQRDDKNYFIALFPGVGNPKFKNERAYAGNLTGADAGYRLLALFRYWNMIQYFYPDKQLIEENWNDVLREFIPKMVNSTSELDYDLSVLALIARIHDTHANIYGNNPLLEKYKGLNIAPVIAKFIEDKAVVTEWLDKDLGEKSGLRTGDIIIGINKKQVKDIIIEKLPLTPASNYPTQLRDIARDLFRTNDSTLDITYERNKSLSQTKIRCYPANRFNLYAHYFKKDTCFKMLTPAVAYIYPGTIRNDYLPRIMDEVQKSDGLIIDMRCYPSEFIVFSLSHYLIPEPLNFVKFSNGNLVNPGYFTYTEPVKVGTGNTDYYRGKVVIIVNELTVSQAEYTTMAFRIAPGAKVIGSTTAGADGNVSEIILPGGIRTMISGIGVYYPDGRETQRVGIIPDVEVRPTINGIREGRDEVLEKAIEIINKK